MTYSNRVEFYKSLEINPFPTQRPRLFPGLCDNQINVLLTSKKQELSEISTFTKSLTLQVLDGNIDIAKKWFMTRFRPSEYVFKFNDLAQEQFPETNLISKEFI